MVIGQELCNCTVWYFCNVRGSLTLLWNESQEICMHCSFSRAKLLILLNVLQCYCLLAILSLNSGREKRKEIQREIAIWRFPWGRWARYFLGCQKVKSQEWLCSKHVGNDLILSSSVKWETCWQDLNHH